MNIPKAYSKVQNAGLIAFGVAGAVAGLNFGLRVGFYILGTPNEKASTK